jgi:hypothetical protein
MARQAAGREESGELTDALPEIAGSVVAGAATHALVDVLVQVPGLMA